MATADIKRIAKNTIFLYFRQILIMAINLYAVRVILDRLGASDYGIYTVVGGVVVLFSFLSNALVSATQRFLNYELGKKSESNAADVFNVSFFLHVVILVVVAILSETVGFLFFKYKLNIPVERNVAALFCFHFSVLSLAFSIIRVPFHATIIAHERMDFFAALSILEAVLKLVVVFCLSITHFDRLILYAFLVSMVSGFITFVYIFYCKRNYQITKFRRIQDFSLFKKMLFFSFWLLAGGIADVSKSQGITMIVNMFCGVIANAALGIARQVNTAVGQFVSNFQTAYTPQVVKSWASGDKDYFRNLVVQSMKVSFMLLAFIGIPFAVNADFVISLWLTKVPPQTITFVRLMLIDAFVYTFIGPLSSAITAVGDIKGYQIGVSIFNFLNLPFSYLCLYCGASAASVLFTRIILSTIALIWRFFYLRNRIGLNPWSLIANPFLVSLIVGAVSLCATWISFWYMDRIHTLLAFLVSCAVSVMINLQLCYLFVLNRSEREAVIKLIKNKVAHR